MLASTEVTDELRSMEDPADGAMVEIAASFATCQPSCTFRSLPNRIPPPLNHEGVYDHPTARTIVIVPSTRH